MSNNILVGRITGAHGIRGAVKIKSFTSDPKAFATYGPLSTNDDRSFTILRLKPATDEFIADLEGVRDRNAAEALAGTDLFVDRAALPEPKDGEFYLADLVGKRVLSDTTDLGAVTGIQNFGAGDLLELEEGGLIPVAFITTVGASIEVELPIGFLDAASHEDRHH